MRKVNRPGREFVPVGQILTGEPRRWHVAYRLGDGSNGIMYRFADGRPTAVRPGSYEAFRACR